MRQWALLAVMLLMCGPAAHADVFQNAAQGDAAAVTAYLDGGGDVNATDQDGATALHHAVAGNRMAVVKLLLERKANVNAAKQDGVTPLHVAAALGMHEIYSLLTNAGANPEAKDDKGRTPVSLAAGKRASLESSAKPARKTVKPTAKRMTPARMRALLAAKSPAAVTKIVGAQPYKSEWGNWGGRVSAGWAGNPVAPWCNAIFPVAKPVARTISISFQAKGKATTGPCAMKLFGMDGDAKAKLGTVESLLGIRKGSLRLGKIIARGEDVVVLGTVFDPYL